MLQNLGPELKDLLCTFKAGRGQTTQSGSSKALAQCLHRCWTKKKKKKAQVIEEREAKTACTHQRERERDVLTKQTAVTGKMFQVNVHKPPTHINGTCRKQGHQTLYLCSMVIAKWTRKHSSQTVC